MEDISPTRKERGDEAIYALLSSIAAAETVQDERSETRAEIIV